MDIRVGSSSPIPAGLTATLPEGLALAPGQVVKALVQAVKADGTVELLIGAVTLEARSEVAVSAGQWLRLLVVENAGRRVQLRLASAEALAEAAERGMAARLEELGVRPEPAVLAAARALVEAGLPVSTENLQALRRAASWVSGGGQEQAALLRALAAAQARGVPLVPAAVKALAAFLAEPGALAWELQEAARRVQEAAGGPSGQGERPGPAARLAALLEELRAMASVEPAAWEEPERVRQALETVGELPRPLRRAAEVLEALAGRSASAPLREAALHLRHAEQLASGQLLLNASQGAGIPEMSPGWHVVLPLLVNGEPEACRLHVWRDGAAREGEPLAGMRLAVALNTATMGQVLFHLHWQPPAPLQVQGVVESEEVRGCLEAESDRLLAALGEVTGPAVWLGARVAAAVGPAAQDMDEGPVANLAGRLDIRA